jgi:hypothetical protein
MSNDEVFDIPGDRPRRLTQLNTLETRENWFKIFETGEVAQLRNSLPYIPPAPEHPGEKKTPQLPRPLYWIFILLVLGIAGIATSYKSWLVILHYLLPVVSFVFEAKTSKRVKNYSEIAFRAARCFLGNLVHASPSSGGKRLTSSRMGHRRRRIEHRFYLHQICKALD